MTLVNRVSRRIRSRGRKRPFDLSFEFVEDRVLLATFTVNNVGDSAAVGSGSLRRAIIDANLAGGGTIDFAIVGSGPFLIQPTSALPTITTPIMINGYSQPGASPNALAQGDNAKILIQLDGLNAPAGADGLAISGSGATIQGLDITRFAGNGINLQSSNNIIEGNFIGTDATGMMALPNTGDGVSISPGFSSFGGISNTTIGGATPAARNVISGNGGNGVNIFGNFGSAASNNVVSGNFIGIDASGTRALGNSGDGVRISNNSFSNMIGGTITGAGNTIAFNGGNGVTVGLSTTETSSIDNSILGNSIFSNTKLGIDLANDGVTPNTPGGPHEGPNEFQNFPVLTSAVSVGGTTTIIGSLNSIPNTEFRVEFFSNAAGDPSGFGEGQTYLGFTTVTTDAAGNASFSFPTTAITPGRQFITATATNLSPSTSSPLNTSEFSQWITAVIVLPVTPLSLVETVQFTVATAVIFDPDPQATPGRFVATIDWGDGTATTPGTVVADGPGRFDVLGSHVYAQAGNYTVRTHVVDTISSGPNGPLTFDVTSIAQVAAELQVTNTSDDDIRGSLRHVINVVNTRPAGGTITFAIPGSGPYIINVGATTHKPLPAVTAPNVTIDGSSQSGFVDRPIIVINGDQVVKNVDGLTNAGLTIAGGNTTVRSLVINGFLNEMGGVGVVLEGPGGDVLENDFIGTDPTVTVAVPNFQGVLILGSSNNRIGGTSPGQRNLISGNASAGMQILDSATVNDPSQPWSPSQIGPASNNLIEGNFIGADVTGTPRLGNGQGVFVNDASGNTIRNNVIAGNKSIDVQILGDHATGNLITGNELTPTRVSGAGVGVYVYAQSGNIVNQNPNDVRVRNLASGPEVENVALLSGNGGITGIVLTFTTYLDRQRAQITGNYLINFVGNHLLPGRSIPIASATYNGIFRTVQLNLGAPIPANAFFQLRVVGVMGRAPRGITDRPGNPLDGIHTLPAPTGGSDDVLYFRQGVQFNLSPVSAGRGAGIVPRTRRQRPGGQRRQRATHPVHVVTTHAASRAHSAAAVDAVFGSGRPLSLHLRRRR